MTGALRQSGKDDAPVLRVAQVIGNLQWGGTQELLVYLAECQARAGLALRVYVLSPPCATPYADRLRQAGAEVRFVPKGRGGAAGQVLRLARALRRGGIQLAHAHLRLANTLTPPAGALAGVPVLGGLHLPHPGGGYHARAESLALRGLARGAIACADSVASDNRPRLGALPIAVVPNPAPPPPDLSAVLARRAEGRTAEVPARFLVVGRLSPEKGVGTVIEAARLLAGQGAAFRLSIVGDGAARGALEARAAGLEGHVSFLGARDDVPELLARHDIYLSASRAEGLSIALLEAMSHALPAIATPAGSAFSVLDDTTGRRVPPGDAAALAAAMAELAADAVLRQRLGLAARARVLRAHRVEDWSAALARHYRRVVAGDFRPGGAPRGSPYPNH
ncbi:glycosyltransferase [Salipiger sp. PrR002]|uniref:glycosyltransferase n=1 Tax=Salipiger sp. PrR002 TaxID=2706489 RepID=UPI0013BB21C1|nr:glycosyltransferase [Salipiger sp. PrR002]NDW00503.1 glycosyltransferase [Salipiger sp. PrR002]NDW57668.1 glycosyltransferase [Salipiger sp. PrR004]